MAIELDENNGINELSGASGYTQGDWVSSMNYPIINIEGTDHTEIVSAYNVVSYPLIYGICPDRRIKNLGKLTTEAHYAYKTDVCYGTTAGIEESNLNPEIQYFSTTEILSIPENVEFIQVLTLDGKVALSNAPNNQARSFDLSKLPKGVFIVQVQYTNENRIFKFNK